MHNWFKRQKEFIQPVGYPLLDFAAQGVYGGRCLSASLNQS